MGNEQNYIEILKNVREGVYFVDTDRKITFWNDHAQRITGFSASEVLNSCCCDNILNHVDDEGNHLCIMGCPLQRTIDTGTNREAMVYLHHKDGQRIPVRVRTFPLYDQGTIIGAIELFSDEKSPLELMHDMEQLRILAMTDQLTGLANRRYADNFLSGKLTELDEFDIPFGVAMIDIDHFKQVNDTHGHDIGDQVLCMAAKSLSHALRTGDLVARWGGEEFLAVCSAVNREQLEALAERMRMLVENSTVQRTGIAIHVTVSIGAITVDTPVSKDAIIRRADHLMYESKQRGRNRITVGSMS